MELSPDEVSRAYSERIFDVAGTTRRKRKIVCPLPRHAHHNYTPSFSIYWSGDRWRWRCHGSCSLHGDVIDLIGYTQVGGYDPVDSKKLSKAISILTGKSYEPAIPKPPKVKKTGLTPNRWRDFYPMSDEVLAYAKARGISEKVLKAHKIGSRQYMGTTWMTIPTFHDGRLLGIKMRNIRQGLRYRGVGGSRRGLFNLDQVKYTTGRVFVVKGEIAAMVMLSRGLTACAPTGGEGMRMTQSIVQALVLADVVVIGDNDPDVRIREHTSELARRRAEELNGQLFFPPNKHKDVDEWILAEPSAIDQLNSL